MKQVLKYSLSAAGSYCSIFMPEGARVLCVAEQYGEPKLWALVDTDMREVLRKFHLIETSEDASHVEKMHFIGTVILIGGRYVIHVFEETPQ